MKGLEELSEIIKQKNEEYEQCIVVTKKCMVLMNNIRDQLLEAINEFNILSEEKII